MTEPKIERRAGARVPVEVPLSITLPDASLPVTGQTRDLSSNGIFFYTEFPIQQGNNVEMILILPPELTSGEKRWVCCQATVVRVEDGAGEKTRGVAAMIQKMELLPEIAG